MDKAASLTAYQLEDLRQQPVDRLLTHVAVCTNISAVQCCSTYEKAFKMAALQGKTVLGKRLMPLTVSLKERSGFTSFWLLRSVIEATSLKRSGSAERFLSDVVSAALSLCWGSLSLFSLQLIWFPNKQSDYHTGCKQTPNLVRVKKSKHDWKEKSQFFYCRLLSDQLITLFLSF